VFAAAVPAAGAAVVLAPVAAAGCAAAEADAAGAGVGGFARDGVELQAPSWASAEALSASVIHRRAAALARAATSVAGL
jgi:hypothetical protein